MIDIYKRVYCSMPHNIFLTKILGYKEKLFGIAYYMLKDRYEAEEIVQEVYLKLWKTRNKVEGYEDLEAYTVRILKNMCIDALRKSKKHIKLDNLEDTVLSPIDSSDLIIQKELKEEIFKIMNHLPELQQQVLKWRHIMGKTVKEIAQIIGKTDNNTRVILSRARTDYKALLINSKINNNDWN